MLQAWRMANQTLTTNLMSILCTPPQSTAETMETMTRIAPQTWIWKHQRTLANNISHQQATSTMRDNWESHTNMVAEMHLDKTNSRAVCRWWMVSTQWPTSCSSTLQRRMKETTWEEALAMLLSSKTTIRTTLEQVCRIVPLWTSIILIPCISIIHHASNTKACSRCLVMVEIQTALSLI